MCIFEVLNKPHKCTVAVPAKPLWVLILATDSWSWQGKDLI